MEYGIDNPDAARHGCGPMVLFALSLPLLAVAGLAWLEGARTEDGGGRWAHA
jgi:hypothetical protein